jgi:hypothetical protein
LYYASATSLRHTLKGLDMHVYQALKRLFSSVLGSHALTDDKSLGEPVEDDYGSDYYNLNIGEAQPPSAHASEYWNK